MKPIQAVLTLFLAVTLLLGGCSGASEAKSPDTQTAPAQESVETQETVEPAQSPEEETEVTEAEEPEMAAPASEEEETEVTETKEPEMAAPASEEEETEVTETEEPEMAAPASEEEETEVTEAEEPEIAAPASEEEETEAQTYQVKMGSDTGQLQYVPAKLTIHPGDTVEFVMNKLAPHNVVFDSSNVPSDAKALASSLSQNKLLSGPGETHTVTFPEDAPKGEYKYYCQPHRGAGMNGVIIVE